MTSDQIMLVSQNLSKSINFSKDTIMRINLAWISSKDTLFKLLEEIDHDVFIDFPEGRIKPPSNSFLVEDIKPLITIFSNIRYIGVSNIETDYRIQFYKNIFDSQVQIVPKIETIKGIKNIKQISKSLSYDNKIIMLDHEDLFTDVNNQGHSSKYFTSLVDELVNYSRTHNLTLLRAKGIIFSN